MRKPSQKLLDYVILLIIQFWYHLIKGLIYNIDFKLIINKIDRDVKVILIFKNYLLVKMVNFSPLFLILQGKTTTLFF